MGLVLLDTFTLVQVAAAGVLADRAITDKGVLDRTAGSRNVRIQVPVRRQRQAAVYCCTWQTLLTFTAHRALMVAISKDVHGVEL
jgi:hypothetical protein